MVLENRWQVSSCLNVVTMTMAYLPSSRPCHIIVDIAGDGQHLAMTWVAKHFQEFALF